MSHIEDYQRKHPRKVEHIPDGEHFAIFVDESFSYDDGYGDRGQASISRHESMSYQVCYTEAELQEWILKNRDKKFKIAIVKPMKFKEHISLEFNQA